MLSPERSKSRLPAKARFPPRVLMVMVTVSLFMLVYVYQALGSISKPGRNCKPSWQPASTGLSLKIALVSLSDSASKRNLTAHDASNRDFGGVLEATRENKDKYAAMHGYKYLDYSHLLDRRRPASWSKILAVQQALKDYDWVFWIDADTVITRPSMPLEQLLPAAAFPDFLVTKDAAGYNAGVWIIRRSEWSTQFLQKWWSMDSFIRRTPGDTKSGDNDALKHYLGNMPEEEKALHVGEVPQCAINSYRWKPSARNWMRYLRSPSTVILGLHQPGDFLLHLAGCNHKLALIQSILPTISYKGGKA